jgi:hypothetical protein
MADEADALPVADDSVLPKLLNLRASNSKYICGAPSIAPFLGLEFACSVIPDELLRKLEFKNIFEYRRKTAGVREMVRAI